MQLTDDELRDVLARAEEIQRAERALRERLSLRAPLPARTASPFTDTMQGATVRRMVPMPSTPCAS